MAKLLTVRPFLKERVFPAAMGFAAALFWFSRGTWTFLTPEVPFSLPVFLFIFALACLLFSRTDLTSSSSLGGKFVFAAPALLAATLLVPWLPLPVQTTVIALAAFATAMMICQWFTLFTELTVYEFALSYAFASLITIPADAFVSPFIKGFAPKILLCCLPFFSAAMLLLVKSKVKKGPGLEESFSFTTKGIIYLFFFSLTLSGAELLSLSFTGELPSMALLKGGAYTLSLAVSVVTLRFRENLSPMRFMGASLFLGAVGILLLGLSVGTGIFFIETGGAVFELAFWLTVLAIATKNATPWRVMAGGLSLVTLALLSSRFFAQKLFPAIPPILGAGAHYVQTGLFFALATLFLFLPSLHGESSGTPLAAPAPAKDKEPAPSLLPENLEEREVILKGIFDSFGLTRQESRVSLLLLDGAGDEEVCETLFISRNTLKYHIRNLLRKLEIPSRKELPDLIEQTLEKSGWKEERER